MKKQSYFMNHPKESEEIARQVINKIIAQITSPPIIPKQKPMTELINHIYNKNYNLYQGKCYQQFSPNLCGYHAIFNTFCFLKLFEGKQCQYDIESGGSFWKFKIKVQKFLHQMKRKYKLPDEWPWRQKDIREGDFERTYNNVCLQRFEEFSLFKKHQSFYYMTHTWLFQYQNLLVENDSKNQLNQKFLQFRKYNGEKPMVLHLMMGITTHWTTFIAIKKKDQVQYWYLDSHNNHHLDFSWQQIVALIERKSKQRVKYGKPQFTNFQKQSYSMCIKDIQTSLKLIIGCLEGTHTLDSYVYNQKFYIFADPLQAAMAADYESVSFVIKQYQYNINAFFKQKVEWGLLSQANSILMKQIIQYSVKMKSYSKQGQFLHSVVKKNTSSSWW